MNMDDGGQLMGTGMLLVSMVAAVFLMGVLWIVCSYPINMLLGIFNGWILEGWVTKQGNDVVYGLEVVWGSLAAYVFLVIIINMIVKAYVLKEARF